MIRVLEKTVADKIAAGEVVERPVSIVKELVENSIDAGASAISVEIRRGGKESIRVTDNGCGIARAETELAFLRHATSKIRKAEDLRNLATLGFRGEALASIAAVSRTEMITKTAEAKTGTRILIHGGETVSIDDIGCPDGTTILVSDLFYNTPARAKFLKNDAAESGMVIELMERIALTRPDIRFRMINNGTTVFATTGDGDLKRAILAVYKDHAYRDLVPVEHADKKTRVYGYVSKPEFSRSNRRSQYFFVNGRVIRDRIIERALASGYKERLFEGRYPVAFLFLETAPQGLDVNIHPNKREVRFDDEIAVATCIRDAVVEALATGRAVTDALHPQEAGKASTPRFDAAHGSSAGHATGKTGSYQVKPADPVSGNAVQEELDALQKLVAASRIAEEETPYDPGPGSLPPKKTEQTSIRDFLKQERSARTEKTQPTAETTEREGEARRPGPFDFEQLTFGPILFGTYITATDDQAFYLFDQHAAHERVNYERFLDAYHNEERTSQLLLLPFHFDVPAAMAAGDADWLEALARMGYQAELFGDNTYIVRAVPQFLTLEEAESFIRDFVDAYAEDLRPEHQPEIDRLILRSCKSSIKAHDFISTEERDALIEQLKKCRDPFSCPHGRPTFIRFTVRDIERAFKR